MNNISHIIAPSASYSETMRKRAFNLLRDKMRRWGYQKLIQLNLQGSPKNSLGGFSNDPL